MEKLSLKRLTTVLVPLSLLLAACGDDETTTAKGNEVGISGTLGITAEYFDDGTRLVHTPENFTDIIQFCDGTDLVDVTSSWKEASSVARSANHPACADGRLTPTDFQITYGG